ncbi:peptidyl-prolyl cis-trans isomerase [Roseivirga sp. E12]|uniref:peptidylprolyl isomerase n=1 Tax=Roseivirga sp. E12 TaxID=2819237 RepID=UPI001ABCA3F6|nr:peptidylprolyl isomerase [Roseivirga sp. E12]MBO3699717.1 peptidyl-prolyl cis-trans isomerase [Roseivirga sp. E12]
MKLKYISILTILLSSLSCDYLGTSDQSSVNNSKELVASVGSSFLFESDIANLVSVQTNKEDSTLIVERYVRNWIKKELLVKEANSSIKVNQSEIEKKVSDYRYTLLSYEYQKQMIQQLLDTAVSYEEIRSYYEDNRENFSLRQNIFRGRYLKISNDAPKKNDIRRWIKSSRPQDLESLKSYAFQFADNYSLEDSTWIKFDDIIKNSPLSTVSNKVQFLRRNRYVEEVDSVYLYLLKIQEYKISEEASPLEFVQEEIRNIILNKRKVALAKGLENDIYERAKENEDYKIYY